MRTEISEVENKNRQKQWSLKLDPWKKTFCFNCLTKKKRERARVRQDTNYQYQELIREELYYKTYKHLKDNKDILRTVLYP